MAERVTVHIEGTVEEIASAIERLAALVRREGRRVGRRVVRPPTLVEAGWTQEQVRRFWTSLRPEARRILREISTRPEGYERAQLLERFSLGGRQLAGRLSSVGHNMRRAFRGKARPLELDRKTRTYRMPPEVAQAIRELEP